MASEQEQLVFGDFRLDASSRQLHRADGSPVSLTPRLYNALYLFASRPGELIDKRELMASLWPGLVVEDNNLSQLISALRRALDDASGHLIRTEPRRGFRFVADVRALHQLPSPAPAQTPLRRTTLAVLPFASLSGGERGALLALGMADTLIARLSTLPQLVVRSLGSVRRFADGRRDAVQAGRELDVDWVIDGVLQPEHARLRASARLLSVAEGTAAWSDRFDVEWTDVFDVQDTIAERVSQALGRQLAHAPSGTRNVDAYQLYLAGLNHMESMSGDGLHKSIALYEHALQIDPGYALAHIGIAEASRRMIFGADRAPGEVYAQLRLHVNRALELAPTLADVHAQLGWLTYWCDHDWPGAERAFRRALALNPSLSLASFGLGFLLVVIGRRREGMVLVQTARELDPMSLLTCTMEAVFLLRLGDKAAAAARLSRVVELAPRFWIAHMALAVWHEQQGDTDAALAAIEQAVQFNPHTSQAAALQGAMLARCGRAQQARAVLDRLHAQGSQRYVPPTCIAAVQAALGDHEAALDSLERAFDCNDTRMLHLNDDPRWNTLRDQARFQRLVARMNLAELPPGLSPP